MFVSIIDDFARDFDVFVERLVTGVNHHAGEPFIDALLAKFEGIAVVQMNRDGDIRQADGSFDELFEVNRVGVLASPFGNLELDGGFFLFERLNDGKEQLHVVGVEGAQRVLPH